MLRMLTRITAAFLGLAGAVNGMQPGAPAPVPAPLRNLTWGQLNFLHTTDTHGWLAGHLQEASYAADWGDYISFASHMRRIAEDAGTDLLVIDTGDRIEGAGLYDSSDPKGLYTADIFKSQQIDVLSSGNHELYKKRSAEDEYFITVPNFHGNYLASNIDIFEPQSGQRVPLAPRYKKFTTKVQGIRIVAFGFLFDFTGNYNNTVVQPVEETIKEEWFQDAIRDKEVDLFLVVGHVAVKSREYEALYRAIRSARWDAPIQFFGGHYHIRDYAKYDDMAYGLASGRFMETIGFMSISGLSTGKEVSVASPSFSRKYIDNNLWSFYHHTGKNETTFPTSEGQKVSKMITKARKALKLDHVHGCSPRDLWMSRAQYPADDSIYTWLEKQVLPETLTSELRDGASAMAIVNTGAIRFDMFKGPFTRDSAYILSPFTGGFRYTKDVPYGKAQELFEVLNRQSRILHLVQQTEKRTPTFLTPPESAGRPHDIIEGEGTFTKEGLVLDQVPFNSVDNSPPDSDLLPGYTTKDDAGTDGDDTVHSAISFYKAPNCIQAAVSPPPFDHPEKVDVIYLEFLEPWIDAAAKFVGIDFDIEKDTTEYMPGASLMSVIVDWVEKNWRCEDEE